MNDAPPLSEPLQQVPSLEVAAAPVVTARNDERAQKEAAGFAAGTLEEASRRAEHGRSEQLRTHIHRAVLCGVWLGCVLFVLALLIVAWHYLAPERFGWLSADQLGIVKTFLFSGALVTAGGNYFGKRVG